MTQEQLLPDVVFETSWEVCNKVGGIYTVLSTRAKTLVRKFKDHLIFIGPDVWGEHENPLFTEDKNYIPSGKRPLLKKVCLCASAGGRFPEIQSPFWLISSLSSRRKMRSTVALGNFFV